MIAIAAAAVDGAIGENGRIPWHIPSDLKRFKELTFGHTVVMGRKTYESLPHGALPGRQNIVLSRHNGFSLPDAEVVNNYDELLNLHLRDTTFVIGGAEIYSLLLPYCNKIYLTRVLETYPEADAFFPEVQDWKLTEQSEIMEENGILFRYETYQKA